MEAHDDKEHGEQQNPGEPSTEGSGQGNSGNQAGATGKAAPDPGWMGHADQSMTIETSQIRGPSEGANPNFVIVPVETNQPQRDRSGPADGSKGNDKRQQGDAKSQQGKDDHPKDQKDGSNGASGNKEEKQKHDHPAQAPSLMRILLFSGLVALVCGMIGAWGFTHFFGSKSGDHKSSSKGSDSGGDSGSGSASGSGSDSGSSKGSGSSQDSGSSKNSENSKKGLEADNLVQAETAWMDAVKELRDARAELKESKRSEDEAKAILDFFKRKLLLVGRSGDATLAEAFWAGGPSKDITLRQAVNEAEGQVGEAFPDRPLAEAAIREMLGLANLSVGEPARAVKQYERAFALREAIQGANQPETADCRNQLAVAYRLAGRTADAGRLFDRSPNSPAHASALAVQGSMLLFQKNPAEAELKLRECMMIRQKIQPNDWSTFDTESMLGEALLNQKKYDAAEPLLLSGYEGMKQRQSQIPISARARVIKGCELLVQLYDAWGKIEEAARWRTELEMARKSP